MLVKLVLAVVFFGAALHLACEGASPTVPSATPTMPYGEFARLLDSHSFDVLFEFNDYSGAESQELRWLQVDGEWRMDLVTMRERLSGVTLVQGRDDEESTCFWALTESGLIDVTCYERLWPLLDVVLEAFHSQNADASFVGARNVNGGELAECFTLAILFTTGEVCFSPEGLPMYADIRKERPQAEHVRINARAVSQGITATNWKEPIIPRKTNSDPWVQRGATSDEVRLPSLPLVESVLR